MKRHNTSLVEQASPARLRTLGSFCLRWIVSWLAIFALNGIGVAQNSSDREYDIKAALLYKFFHYVDWRGENNPETGDVVTIGILGENPFGASLEPLTLKTVKGKKLVIRQLKDIQEARHCQVVFISASEKVRLPQIFEALQHQCVLTVGEVDGFAEHGGIINLIADRNKVRFEINPEAAEKARLNINPQLLKVAKLVKG